MILCKFKNKLPQNLNRQAALKEITELKYWRTVTIIIISKHNYCSDSTEQHI